ncbi:alpha/beta hydrolase [Pseudidiomarina planktonica]|nr:alpha/beta hydrolase [Pseudidiomarina planktonica]
MKFVMHVRVIFALLGLLAYSNHALAQVPVEAKNATNNDCYIDGISERIRCGNIQVPENYEQPNGRQISIHYAVLPAVQEGSREDPLLILAGGPGQAATELAPMMNRMFTQVRQQRDILLIDQRGTGQSNPLSCDIERADELVRADNEQALDEMAAECLAQYPDSDLTQYHTVNAVRDFETVRQQLGYPSVNLYGGSYGTRAGLVYLREAPDAVRSAVLDAVAPTQVVIGPFGLHGAQSFAQLLEHCEQDTSCRQEFPNLDESYRNLMQKLDSDPAALVVNDPLTNEPLDLLVTSGRLSSVLRVALYHPSTRRLVPYTIRETAAQNYEPLVGLMGTMMSQSPLYLGLTLSVLCSEDLPRATPALLADDANNTFIGGRTAEAFIDMCKPWPSFTPDPSWSEPVQSDKPVLLLSGQLDPVTPVAWGELAASTLTNSRHLVAPFGAHTIASHTCANRLIANFIESLDAEQLDASCLQQQQRATPFVRSSNGAGM